ncbi:MAG: M14 family metallopeptidase [Clostridia bacterium]
MSNLKFDHYYTYDKLTKSLESLANEHPNFSKLSSIGKSYEKRDVWCITITDYSRGKACEKSAIYIDGNTHAGEVTGSVAALYTANYLLENKDKEDIAKLLRETTFYIIPRVNPDGAEFYLTTPNTLRSSVRVWPDENITELPGLHREDIDGDGYILNMRVRDDKRGAWKISKQDPRLMEPRKLDEREGEFYHIIPEGIIKEYEGEPIEINPVPWRLDLNRNYPSEWNPEIKGGGDYPTSEPEIKNIVDFIIKHKNIGALEALHTSGGILFRSPYTYPEEEFDQKDLKLLKTIGERGEELTGYPDVPSTGGIFAATIVDWAYEHQGIPGFTPELWDLYGRAGVKMDWHKARKLSSKEKLEREFKVLEFNDKELSGKGFFDWQEFDHPQLGKVEIGGYNPKFFRQNPPHNLLEQECHKMAMFMLAHAKALPKIEIEELSAKKVDKGIYEINILVANHGFLSTNLTNKGKKNEVIDQDKVEIILSKNASLVSGEKETKIGYLQGYFSAQGDYNRTDGYNSGCKRIKYIIKAEKGSEVIVKVISQKGGTVTKKLNI